MKKAALTNGEGRYYAIRHLPKLSGEKAAPLLRALVLQLSEDWSLSLWQAMCELGEKAAPTLLEMLGDDSHPQAQRFAVECVWSIGQPCKDAVPVLIKMRRSADQREDQRHMRGRVADALGSIGPESRDALPLLRALANQTEADLTELRKSGTAKQLQEAEYLKQELANAIGKIDRSETS